MIEQALDYQRQHPYQVSLAFACLFMAFILFYAGSFELTESVPDRDQLEFVDLSELQIQRRRVRRQVTTEQTENSDVDTERAKGTSDSEPIDMAFEQGIAKPQLIGKLSRRYPKLATEHGVDALVIAEVTLSEEGKVIRVTIEVVKLLKELPPALTKELKSAFRKEALRALRKARFTPPIVRGRKHALRMEQRLNYRLK